MFMKGFFSRYWRSLFALICGCAVITTLPACMTRQGRNGGSPLLIITSIASSNISGVGATITWSTNMPADSLVEYGLTTAYGNQVSLKTLATSHKLTLIGLSSGKLYHYRVKSTDEAGNLSTSGGFTFTTTNSPTPIPIPTPPPGSPVISSFTASPVAITGGQTSVLSWVVTGATSLRLDPGAITVTGATSRQVTPSVTTAYTLTATNSVGAVTGIVTVTVASASQGAPELPRVFLNTGYIPPTGKTFNVAAGQSVQDAINQAQAGDVIMLKAGATFTGNFVLPNKSGSSWIIIRSDAADTALPPPGTRVSPASASLMPKLVSQDPNTPVVQTADGAHHYRFIGVEFSATTDIYNIVSFGGDQASPAATPHDLIIDRCYIHGNPANFARRGVLINSASTAIIDSYISDIHEIGADSQSICGWNGTGPFKIVNNYLEGAGENFMLGGSPPSLPNLIPSDIEFRLNNLFKPLLWKANDPTYAGKHWTIKNLFELKNAQRALVDQNVFENNWADAQNGFAILFTPRGENGVAPQATAADVTFTNNILRHSGSGLNIAGPDDTSPSQPSQRILIRNNLIDDINGGKWTFDSSTPADGRAFQTVGGPVNITIDHNTAFETGAVIVADGAPSPGFVFRNNIALQGDDGVFGSGQGTGLQALAFYYPSYEFRRNVIIGAPSSNYPLDNFYPSLLNLVGFVDFANGNYRLGPNSPYANQGTDGQDIGCDFTALGR
ncbi:MAG: fibronectin type III domain-containing protein [Chloracidobacterium sp.]|nr:fibronectin type III domain-containing protein [Chloracidobacterium sp.]